MRISYRSERTETYFSEEPTREQTERSVSTTYVDVDQDELHQILTDTLAHPNVSVTIDRGVAPCYTVIVHSESARAVTVRAEPHAA